MHEDKDEARRRKMIGRKEGEGTRIKCLEPQVEAH